MSSILVSICIPVYNGGSYLRQCLDTCLGQSFSDYEIVICDDGSTDNSVAVIESYAAKHSKIRFFKNPRNLGLVGNWNRCLEEAKGEWIKFVFQDDYITGDCLAEFVKVVDDKTMLMISQRHFILPEQATKEDINYYGHVVRTLENTTVFRGTEFSPKLISAIAAENICMNFIGEPSLSFFRKSVVKEVGMFNAHLKQICDLEFLLRIASRYGLKYIPNKLCAFRIHAGSTTNKNISDRYFALRYLEPVLFSWFLLFDIQFAPFRSQLTVLQMAKLKLYFRFKTYQAYKVNVSENRGHELFTEHSPFKEISNHKKGDWLVKLADKLKSVFG